MPKRMPQVNEMLQKTLGEIFSQNIEIPPEYFISIAKVECATDLKTAKIFVSVLPFEKAEEGLKYLINNRKEIQRLFGLKINLKYTPVLKFILDTTEQKAEDIYSIMDSL